ncbi:hypothetical protein SAM23877_2579 [Streptomyces ambofaciens ATCC 23877]|uniref:Uncharacterized protein n=1 Tax=Streptomyces ambofaciens (strain ATCC 23877 / 3486 / DSM 40053 / JCM 4204 / NBRC 12836 / NRRL B-2516) TaxID=278992 RepID=A0A0K2ARK6_STRA7|nr:hypothetical protein SAM23877_2579 [Streptomyces ambofaciens ATCC 23877]
MTSLSPPATMIGEKRYQPAPPVDGEWYTALFVLFPSVVPHTDTDPRDRRGSARVLGIMRFGLLLLSCRGEGL